jgi:ABC-type branched-subunit amino acid transport system substrate-binding protein
MSDNDKEMAADTLRILHGARSLPPPEAAEALKPFLALMMRKKGAGDKLADASADAVMALAQSLKENHAASDDLWQEAIEATLSYANEVG